MKKLLLISLSILFISATYATKKPKIWVLGDSTLCSYSSSLYPRTGWAQVLSLYLNTDSVEVHNKALSGRSSKSFFTDAAGWRSFKDSIIAGDYVLIEFGHNDEKTSDTARGTLPGSTFEQYLSIYIDYAKKVGAIPILGTPIQRNSWGSDNITLKQTHVTSEGDYPKAIRNLAASKGIALIDMTKLTNDYFQKIGKSATTKLFMNLTAGQYSNYPDGCSDNTHLQEAGAKAIAQLFTSDVVSQKLSPIYKWVKSTTAVSQRTKPADAVDKVIVQNGIAQVKSSNRVSDFSIVSINGKFVNNKGIITHNNHLLLTSNNGQALPSGNYILNYKLSNGTSNSACVRIHH